jgi:hypothetical protein
MGNYLVGQWHVQTSAVALLAILCACGQSKDSQASTKAMQLNPAQATCIEVIRKRQVAVGADFASKHFNALAAKRSDVEITLAERRANEKMCMDYAQCFSDRNSSLNDIVISTMFSSCLKEVETEP